MLERIREAIASELVRLGATDVSDMRETLLIRNGLFCGRKYQCLGFHVVWFMEENEIKFFGPTGQLLMATSLSSAWQKCQLSAASSRVRILICG